VRRADLREIGIFGQEAVAGVDRIAAADQRGTHHRGLVQVAAPGLGRADADRLVRKPHCQGVAIGLAVGDHGRDGKIPAGAQDPHRDLAAIRDQHLGEH